MKSITIHDLDDPLNKLIRERAQQEGLSINKTIKKILADALGFNKTKQSKTDEFNDLCGVWSVADHEEFTHKTADFERIDASDWK